MNKILNSWIIKPLNPYGVRFILLQCEGNEWFTQGCNGDLSTAPLNIVIGIFTDRNLKLPDELKNIEC